MHGHKWTISEPLVNQQFCSLTESISFLKNKIDIRPLGYGFSKAALTTRTKLFRELMSPWFASSEFSIFTSPQLGPVPLPTQLQAQICPEVFYQWTKKLPRVPTRQNSQRQKEQQQELRGKNSWWRKSELFWTSVYVLYRLIHFDYTSRSIIIFSVLRSLEVSIKPHQLAASAQAGRAIMSSPFWLQNYGDQFTLQFLSTDTLSTEDRTKDEFLSQRQPSFV